MGEANKNLAVRVATAVVGVPIILWGLFLAPPRVFPAMVAVAVGVAAAELFAMVLPGARVLQTWGVVASVLWSAGLYCASTSTAGLGGAGLGALALLLAVISLLVSLGRPEPHDEAGARMAWLLAGPLYISLLGTLALLFTLPGAGGWVILAMMLAWLGDTGGYFAGRFLGKRPLFPAVSPKKTVEGAFGALAGSTLGALLAHFWYLPRLPLVDAVGLGLVASSLGMCGDLCESLIKRSVGVKDSGRIIPGHGGLLDRVDALMFTSTSVWFYALWRVLG